RCQHFSGPPSAAAAIAAATAAATTAVASPTATATAAAAAAATAAATRTAAPAAPVTAIPAPATAVFTPRPAARRKRLRRWHLLHQPPLIRKDVTAIDPGLDADIAICGARFRETVVDVGAKGVQRDLAVLAALPARHLGSAQAAGDQHPDPLRAHAH